MTTVNPPPVPRIPKTFLKDKDTRAFFQDVQKILLQLWIKVDGGSDSDLTNLDHYLTDSDVPGLLKSKREEIDIPEIDIIRSQHHQLKKEVEMLKEDHQMALPTLSIIKRIEDIEVQL